LNEDFHLKLVDFGTATYVGKTFDKNIKKFRDIEDKEEIDNLVGTAEYVAPEAISNHRIGLELDLWSLGKIYLR